MREELRLVRFTCNRDAYENGRFLKKGKEYIELRKVFINKNDVLVSSSTFPISICGESKEDIQELRGDLEIALSLPILDQM